MGICLILNGTDPFDTRRRTAVLFCLLVLLAIYLYWRVSSTLPPWSMSFELMWMYLFLITEIIASIYIAWQCLCLTRHSNRSQECSYVNSMLSTERVRAVDLYIPTVSEPKELLIQTIDAAKRVEYSDLHVWVCDDGNRAWLRDVCDARGVHYLSRSEKDMIRTKAGNLRWSLGHGQAEYIACIDADFKVMPEFISRLVLLLADETVGLVQAPQHFRNRDVVQKNLNCEKAWTEEQRFFFDIVLPARDAWNNALCVGSCWAARRSTIDAFGGFPTDSVVEDVYLGYMVKASGLKTIYLNERLATGLAAESAPSYISQRARWCAGAMSLLSAPHGPLRSKHLSLIDRLFYAEIPFYWLTHLHLLMLLIAPIVFSYFGYQAFHCSSGDLFSIILPKCIVLSAVFYWISEGRCIPIITPLQRTLPIFYVCFSLVKGLIFPSSLEFKVTEKLTSNGQRRIHWAVAAPFIIIGILTTVGICKMFMQNYSRFSWTDYSAYNAMLSGYSLITVLLCCVLCVDQGEEISKQERDVPLKGNIWLTLQTITRRVFCWSQ